MKDWIFSSSQGGESETQQFAPLVHLPSWHFRQREFSKSQKKSCSYAEFLPQTTIHHPTLKWWVWLVLCWTVATVEKTQVSILTGNTGYGTTQSNFYLSIRCRKLQQEKLSGERDNPGSSSDFYSASLWLFYYIGLTDSHGMSLFIRKYLHKGQYKDYADFCLVLQPK